MQTIDRISQLEQSERDALLRALLTVFARADCRCRVLASQELPSLLAQAGFDAARCSPALLEDAALLCAASFLTLPADPSLQAQGAIAAQGLSDFGTWLNSRMRPYRWNTHFLSRAAFVRLLLVDAPLLGLVCAVLVHLAAR